MVSDCRGGDDFESFVVVFAIVQSDQIDDDDDLGIGGPVWIESEGSASAGDDQPDVRVAQAAEFDGFLDRIDHFLFGHGDRQQDGAG